MSTMNGYSETQVSRKWYTVPKPGEEVVLTGIAGRFPESDNMRLFQQNLMNKMDLITDDGRRWKLDHPEIPQRTGKVNNINKFDAPFFGINFKQAHTMDPMCRMLLEHAYEAIVDAGINPKQLRGSRTGVFVGACFSESEKTWFYEKLQLNGYGITGCSRAMLANRISYWLGLIGPSYTVDSACSSSLFAMEHAYRAIRNGQCDAALVGGSNLCLHPYVSLQFSRLGVLGTDGRCKSFDADANGYARSETIAVIFLQKAKDAKRIYATMIHGKTNCDGFKEEGITFPSSAMQSQLFKEFYEECEISPTCLNYMEAHGTGTRVGDPEEINAIDKIFCTGRSTPLKIGSIKSNLGHTEPASGLCSIAKVVLAMESGRIPPNLHFKRPREDVKPLVEGRMVVITEPTPWELGYAGVNSFGFGGANAHVLLKSNEKEKINGGAPKDDLPRLVAVSGRTEEAIVTLLDDIESRPVDAEYINLFHNIHSEEIAGHTYRGYTIVGTKSNEIRLREIENFQEKKRPMCYVFSGMGSQWPGMGEALMRFPVFAKAIEKCNAVLKPHGVNVHKILTSKDKSIFDSILNSLVGIAAVQIGLVDLLSSLGITPDHIIGHSFGELGCAYADGSLTAEQTILSAYSRGVVSVETKVIRGSMAVVGLGYKDLKGLCPSEIEIACHNGPDSATISGPADVVKAFVAKLQANKIFAKEVPCSNIPYHSRYVAAIGPKLLSYLKKIIPEPKLRSGKWLSTSVPSSEWSKHSAKFSSAEYHTNNLLKPVLFEEATKLIPEDAVTVEIAPHALLQAILKRSLPETVKNVALTQKNDDDNVEVFLQGVGKLYNSGFQPNIAKLYPPIQYPVSRGTPMISPLIRWDHSEDWYVSSYKMQEKITSGERIIEVTLRDEDFEYISGHVVDGRNLFPATGYLTLVWETLGMMMGQLYSEVSVVMENVKFNRATTISKEGKVEFTVMIQKGSGKFEVVEGGTAVVTGSIRATTDLSKEKLPADLIANYNDDEDEPMTTRDIYKELKLRGYQYSGLFRSLHSASLFGKKGHIEWRNNWVAFMDNMLQIQILALDTRGLFVPTAIKKLVIDTKTHLRQIRDLPSDKQHLPVRVYKEFETIMSGGVEIFGAQASAIPRKKPAGDPVLEQYKFIAHRDNEKTTLQEMLRLSVHIALENQPMIKVKTIEVIDENEEIVEEQLASPLFSTILGDLPLIQGNVNLAAPADKFNEENLPQNVTICEFKKIQLDGSALIAIGSNLLKEQKDEQLKQLILVVKDGGFIITRERDPVNESDVANLQKKGLDVILEKRTDCESLLLLKKKDNIAKNTVVIHVNNDEFSWLEEVQKILNSEEVNVNNTRVILVGEGDFDCGLLGFVNCIRREPGGEVFKAFLVQDLKAPKFSLENPLYANQLQLNLVVNVLRSGNKWGSYRHLLLPPLETKVVPHALASQTVRGDLTSLCWSEGPLCGEKIENLDIIHVLYSPLNFKDVMLATGKLAVEVVVTDRKLQDCVIGMEYAGIDKAGRRIMGLLDSRCLTNYCVADRSLSWEIPAHWSFEDAATVPCVYGTCYYALFINGQIKKGDKVLIHAGSGGIGQAAIHLALYQGCEVFTTVGTPEKRRFIRETFPAIPEDHIGNSRDTSFEQMIMKQTNGRGVDIVLNSLAEEKLQASIRCLAQYGRFLEIGKVDFAANNPLGLRYFTKEISFYGVMLDNLFFASNDVKINLNKTIREGLQTGAIKPLTRKVFSKDQLETAFRYMAAGKHIGKVIIKIHEEDEPFNTPMVAIPRYYCKDNASYVILGGLGGFGMELTDWLILRGARNLVLTSRSGVKNGYQRMRVELWKSYGVNVSILVGYDASKREDCEFILKTAKNLGPVDGIFNLAVVLKDSICKNQTPETFAESFKTKAWATKCLDELSRKHCPQLRHFVVFSSVSCGRGNAGQTNYGMANSVMERICEKRVEEGLPGLAVQWGAVGDVGLVADMQENDKELVIGGTLQQKITSCLQELNGFLLQDQPVVASMVVAEKRAGSSGAHNVVDTVLNIMGVKDLKSVSQQTPLAELGMDSMMAVEIKQTLEREYEIYLTAQDIRSLNFAKLAEMANKDAAKNANSNDSEGGEIEKIAGMKLFLRLIGKEKLNADLTMKLETKAEENRGDVLLIPGIEGYGQVFSTVATNLKVPATCLQLAMKHEYNTVEEMAEAFLPYALEKYKSRGNFLIVGYSYGTLLAVELVRKLEAEGLNGRLILIDGSPDQMKLLKNQHIYSSTAEELQSNVILGVMDVLYPVNSAQLVVALGKCNTWEEKVDAFFSLMPIDDSLKIPPEMLKILILSLYKRMSAISTYDPSPLPYLRTPIVLLKPTLPAVVFPSEDYNLKKLTREKVEVHLIEGNHITMLDNPKIAAVINGEPLEDAETLKTSIMDDSPSLNRPSDEQKKP